MGASSGHSIRRNFLHCCFCLSHHLSVPIHHCLGLCNAKLVGFVTAHSNHSHTCCGTGSFPNLLLIVVIVFLFLIQTSLWALSLCCCYAAVGRLEDMHMLGSVFLKNLPISFILVHLYFCSSLTHTDRRNWTLLGTRRLFSMLRLY